MLQVLWMAPFYSGGGYCSEAHAFLSSIQNGISFSNNVNVTFAVSQHGDTYRQSFFESLTSIEKERLSTLDIHNPSSINKRKITSDISTIIAICHSEPGAWNAPHPFYHTFNCPPNYADIKIGRTMFETNQIPTGWVNRLNYMDEIWVPTDFSKQIFLNAGVHPNKIQIVAEPIDTDFFSPKNISTLFDSNTNEYYTATTISNHQYHHHHHALHDIFQLSQSKNNFLFLFVGKWETRKGLKLLLRAYCQEFFNHHHHHHYSDNSSNTSTMNVHLIILTSQYHSSSIFMNEIYDYLSSENFFISSATTSSLCTNKTSTTSTTTTSTTAALNQTECNGANHNNIMMPSLQSLSSMIHVLTDIDQMYMPYLYSVVDVLVIPSHGEGWGRPHVEAMACETPVIATNWSGVTAYLTERNGYPLRIEDHLVAAEGWPGHEWAQPSGTHLRELMRHVVREKEMITAATGATVCNDSCNSVDVNIINCRGNCIDINTAGNDNNNEEEKEKEKERDDASVYRSGRVKYDSPHSQSHSSPSSSYSSSSSCSSSSYSHYHQQHCVTSELRMKGKQARKDMITHYSLTVMGEVMLSHFERIRNQYESV